MMAPAPPASSIGHASSHGLSPGIGVYDVAIIVLATLLVLALCWMILREHRIDDR